MDSTTYGLDIAKNVMQLHWVDAETGEIGRYLRSLEGRLTAVVDRLEESHCLAASDLAQHNPVGPHAQGRGQKHISAAGIGVTVGDQRHGIWLLGT